MSIDEYFLSRSSTMPPKNTKKAKATDAESSPSTELATSELLAASKAAALDPALRQVIQEITGNITVLVNEKIDPISQMLQAQALELKELVKRTSEAESRIAAQEEASSQAEERVKVLEKQVMNMAQHIDDLENRGRRKNIRVVGLPEGAEGTEPVKFFEKWLPDFLHIEAKEGRIKLERAHRAPAPRPGPDQRPRVVLIRFHNFRDKQLVLQASRRSGTSEKSHPQVYQGSKVMFFQDFSADITRKRKGFDQVKKRLREAGIPYSLLYPARLRITHNGSTKVFDTPEKALSFTDSMD